LMLIQFISIIIIIIAIVLTIIIVTVINIKYIHNNIIIFALLLEVPF